MLGLTVPQKESFYGAPTLAARLGFPGVSGPMISQACATSVAAIHAAGGFGYRRPLGRDHRPYEQRSSPRLSPTNAPGGTAESENWVLDAFDRDL